MNGLQATVEVTFFLPNGGTIALEFVIDTGFAGALTLPPAAVAAMNLPFYQHIDTNLADDSGRIAQEHRGIILWHGENTVVPILALGKRSLLGTFLLAGYELNAQFAPNGRVVIDEIV